MLFDAMEKIVYAILRREIRRLLSKTKRYRFLLCINTTNPSVQYLVIFSFSQIYAISSWTTLTISGPSVVMSSAANTSTPEALLSFCKAWGWCLQWNIRCCILNSCIIVVLVQTVNPSMHLYVWAQQTLEMLAPSVQNNIPEDRSLCSFILNLTFLLFLPTRTAPRIYNIFLFHYMPLYKN